MRACVQANGDTSEAFVITNKVQQGCILAPILFCLMFSAMLQDAFHHSEDGIHIIYQTDRKLHNLHHLKAVTKVRLSSETSCLPMTVPSTQSANKTCRTAWTDSPKFATISVPPLAWKKNPSIYSTQLLASPISSLT